jgi:hypothetical protein
VGQPPRALQAFEVVPAIGSNLPQPDFGIRNEVPGALAALLDRDNLRAAALHFECQESAGGADLQHTPSGQRDMAQVLVNATAQIPLAISDAVSGNLQTW